MATNTVSSFSFTENKNVRVTKICVQEGHIFVTGQIIFHYDITDEETTSQNNKNSHAHGHGEKFVRANSSGLVESIKVKEGDQISQG